MEIRRDGEAPLARRTELLVVPLAAGESVGSELETIDRATGGRLVAEIRRRTSDPAKRGSVSVYQTHGALPAELIGVVGVGALPAEGTLELDTWRRFAGQAIELARSQRAREVAISLASLRRVDRQARAFGATIEGALLAAYRFDRYKT